MIQDAAGQVTWVSVTGTVAISSANCQILGWMAAASVTQGSIQFFASATSAVSASPVIPILTTGAFSRYPVMCSGSGLTIKYTGTLDPNLLLFWMPVSGAS